MEKNIIYQKPEIECIIAHAALMQNSIGVDNDHPVDGGSARSKDYYYNEYESGANWED